MSRLCRCARLAFVRALGSDNSYCSTVQQLSVFLTNTTLSHEVYQARLCDALLVMLPIPSKVGSVVCHLSHSEQLRLKLGARCRCAFAAKTSSQLHSMIATWLILPVVICLSQRLSHACLSTCFNKAKPRMAH